jgi:hypothetical protein
MKGFRLALVVGVTLMGFGCADSVFDVAEDAVYVLERVNGDPLPATVVLTQFQTLSLTSDTLFFRPGNRFESVRWLRTVERGTGVITVERQRSEGAVIRTGDSFNLVVDICADRNSLALCIEPDAVRVDGSSLIFEGAVPPAGRKEYRSATS